MAELAKDLNTARRRLVFALDEYVDACSAVQEHCKNNLPSHKLADRVANESLQASSLENQLRKATSMIHHAKNYTLLKTTINSLPSELLTRIFHLVVGSRPCGVRERSGEKIRFPKYPDFLSHVCSRWRDLALNTPTLWTHIDYVPYHSLSPAFDRRANIVADRTQELPLDIHVYEPAFLQEYDYTNLTQFIADVSPQIRSFELVVSEEFSRETVDILEAVFDNCIPQIFTKLAIVYAGEMPPILICPAADVDEVDDGLWMQIEPGEFKCYLPFETLHLDGVHFPWTHPVYYNLVELRLTSTQKPSAEISKSELVDILASSSRLRVLHFGHEIVEDNPSTTEATVPVRLPALEVLNLTTMGHDELGMLTCLLNTGPQALQFSIGIHDTTLPAYGDDVLKFVSSSHITRLHVIAKESTYPEEITLFDRLLHPAPHVQELVVDGFHWPQEFKLVPGPCDCSIDRKGQRLEVLYILNSFTYLNTLRQIVRRHPTKKMVLWDCRVWGKEHKRFSESEIKSMLSGVCSDVRVMEGGPSPVEHWDW